MSDGLASDARGDEPSRAPWFAVGPIRDPAAYRYAAVDCPSDHDRGMVYDPETDGAICPLCGTRESTEMGSL